MFKKALPVVLLALSCIAMSGCKQDILPAGSEIEHYAVMQVSGLDKSSENPDDIEVTFLTQDTEKSVGPGTMGGGKQIYSISSASGKTVFDAERKLKTSSDKKVVFGYVDYFLIGEDAAKDNFTKYFDFIVRDHEIRYTPKLYLVKGCSAKDFINKTMSAQSHLPDRLDNIDVDISLSSNFDELTLIEVAAMLNDHDAGTVIPALALKEIKDEKLLGGELPEMDVATDGYAVLKDFKLAGYIEESCARGYNLLTDKVKSSAVNVTDSSGQQVALELVQVKTKARAQFTGDTLTGVTYQVHGYSNIPEQHSLEFIYTKSELGKLCAQQSDILKSEMEQVIALSKDIGIDCIELGERIRMKHPNKWKKIKDNWRELFTNLDITVEVDSDIRRTYDLHEPNGFKLRND